MPIESSNLSNGIIELIRDKFDNTHIKPKSQISYKNSLNRYEIYSVKNTDGKVNTVGDIDDYGIISDFFVTNNEIYIRYNRIIQSDKNMKLKKICVKL